jgi:hypothetical protein
LSVRSFPGCGRSLAARERAPNAFRHLLAEALIPALGEVALILDANALL